MSWITLDDLLAIFEYCMFTESIRGPVNAVAPEACTQRVFAQTLAQCLKRPAVVPMPAFVLRSIFGELADQVLLASIRVKPAVLSNNNFQFSYPRLVDALGHVCGVSDSTNENSIDAR